MVHFGPKSHSIFVRMDLDFVRMDLDFVSMDQDFLRRAISSKKANTVPLGFRQISIVTTSGKKAHTYIERNL